MRRLQTDAPGTAEATGRDAVSGASAFTCPHAFKDHSGSTLGHGHGLRTAQTVSAGGDLAKR